MSVTSWKNLTRNGLFGSAWAISLLFAGWAGYESGGRAGFNDGYMSSAVSSHGICAADAIRSIREISAGDLDEAVDRLDSSVDGALLLYWGSEGLDLERFNATGYPAPCLRPYKTLIGPYRTSNPPKGLDAETAAIVASVASRLASGQSPLTGCNPRPPHNKTLQTDESADVPVAGFAAH